MKTAKSAVTAVTASESGQTVTADATVKCLGSIWGMPESWKVGVDIGARKGETMGKLYQNKWAGYETYFTPTHPVRTRKREDDAIGGYEITRVNGKWKCRKGQYYTHSLRDEEHFPVVGDVKINILGYVMETMLNALERRTDG